MSDIFIVDDQHPEDNAMLQALYSRSPQSVLLQLEKVKKAGSGKFMDQFYIGYGHKSIGDCGSTTLFIEGGSMLAAKAVQDSPLYNGQEASTRYINMSEQPMVDPVGTEASKAIQDRWMAFYNKAMPTMTEHLAENVFPRKEGEDEKAHKKAIKARAFDVMRGFLPAGCATFVSWHTNLRQAGEHLDKLRHSPCSEIRQLGEAIESELVAKYPNSFSAKRYPETEEYLRNVEAEALFNPDTHPIEVECTSTIKARDLDLAIVALRPEKARLPHYLDELGQVTYKFLMDFGSFRDLQRHRNGVCRMPLVSTRWGFNEWYLEQLPDSLRHEAEMLVQAQTTAIDLLLAPLVEKQHLVAMGFNVPCQVTRGLPGTLYLIDLRTTKVVHPTMRKVAQDMATSLQALYPVPNLIKYADMEPGTWDLKRGKQDIEAK